MTNTQNSVFRLQGSSPELFALQIAAKLPYQLCKAPSRRVRVVDRTSAQHGDRLEERVFNESNPFLVKLKGHAALQNGESGFDSETLHRNHSLSISFRLGTIYCNLCPGVSLLDGLS